MNGDDDNTTMQMNLTSLNCTLKNVKMVNIMCILPQFKNKEWKQGTYLSISCQSHWMMWATSYFNHLLDQEISTDLDGSNALVGCPIPKLAISIVAPGVNNSIYTRWPHTENQLQEEMATPVFSSPDFAQPVFQA